jgi:phage protein U
MSLVMMALGPFRFATDALLLAGCERRLPARHADIELVGRAPGSQFLGPGVEIICLPAVLYPHYLGGAGLGQLEGLRAMAEAGAPLMLVSGAGRVLGRYTIREVADMREHFLPNGLAAKVEIRIELARYAPVGGIGVGAVGVGLLFG